MGGWSTWRRVKTGTLVGLFVLLVNAPLLTRLAQGPAPSPTMWLLTGAVDAALVGFGFVLMRFGRYGGVELIRAEALGPLVPATTARGIDELGDGEVVIRGDVVFADRDEVELDVNGIPVLVILDGHANPLTRGRVAEVRARKL